MKNTSEVMNELSSSIQTYGYAVIVTHQQEFMKDCSLDSRAMAVFDDLVNSIEWNYSFTLLEKLSQRTSECRNRYGSLLD